MNEMTIRLERNGAAGSCCWVTRATGATTGCALSSGASGRD